MGILSVISIIAGFASAAAWLYASRVKVTRESAIHQRKQKAAKEGTTPNLSGVTFDGWEVRETFEQQSKWNSIGAVLAAIAVFSQTLAQAFQQS